MTNSRRYRYLAAPVLLASTLSVSRVQAQACLGTPSRSNIAYENGSVSYGQSHGASAALVGRRTALGLAARFGEVGDLTSQDGALRFAIRIPAGKVEICPTLGLGLARRISEPSQDWTITSNTVTLQAGIGVGIEQQVFAGISVIPFVAARYGFGIVAITIDAPDAETEVSGDTLSGVDFEYGLMGRWKVLFGGVAAQRNSDSGSRPYFARYVLGFTFGSTSKKE